MQEENDSCQANSQCRTEASSLFGLVCAWFERVLIVAGLVLLFTNVKHEISGCDAVDRYRAIADFIEKGRVSTTPYSLLMPLCAAPLHLIGHGDMSFQWWCERFNVIVLGLGLLGFWLILRRKVDPSVIRRFILLLLAGSMFPAQTRNFYADLFTAVLVSLGLLALATRGGMAGWIAIGAGAVNLPGHLVAVTVVAANRVWHSKRLRHILVVASVVLLVAAENWWRRGHPLATHYEGNHGVRTLLPYSGLEGFSFPFFFGVLSLLFSFGKGVVFFAPGLLLIPFLWNHRSVPDCVRKFMSLALFYAAGLLMVYGCWWAWYGGFSWGPRFLLIASVPASLALAIALGTCETASQRAAVLACLLLSVWVGMGGAVFYLDNLEVCNENNYAYEHLMWFVPEFSVLWRPFVTAHKLRSPAIGLLCYGALVAACMSAPVVRSLVFDIAESLRRLRRGVSQSSWRF
jgi:hypothetical protein